MLAVQAGQLITFVIASLITIGGAVGVIAFHNPVHNALSLIATLFGMAVLYVAQGAYFVAAVQVIVYAGAIVVLFVFVIMLLGVDRIQSYAKERAPRTLLIGGALGAGFAVMLLISILGGIPKPTGQTAVQGPIGANDINAIGESLFTTYIFAFEITSLLLTVAIVGAVVLSRKPSGEPIDLDEFPTPVADVSDAELEEALEREIGAEQ
ncbi:MAG: NADH-quinone oxidoreductase subunit J [Actinobacteria bacterium]|nr:NADH-quinone oxidoreductase subunit J [Actinomycetota bacterium]